ncbi:nucleotidyltransferase domain-containing protein [Aliarcobacter cryaerophilus]|uniref:nucleotidyltransferase domain-containing protein n=1 Tax=Aliarcobacter cryaerophilus TaxID=28198 RepID=UPI0013DEFEE5|nr:nucleotidyltransferase domain-containing protein [Aliarcobacter cryaerophilus]
MNFEKIDINVQNEILFIKKELIKINKNKIFTMFLIGSVARNTYNENSDIDIVIIHSGEEINIPKFIISNKKVQIISYNKKEVKSKFNSDEILIWTLKYGILIYDKNFIFNGFIIKNDDITINKLIIKKKMQIENLFTTFDKFIELKLKNQEILYPILNKLKYMICRYLILLENKIPTSKHELKQELIEYGKYDKFISIYDEIDKANSSMNSIEIYFKLRKYFLNSF